MVGIVDRCDDNHEEAQSSTILAQAPTDGFQISNKEFYGTIDDDRSFPKVEASRQWGPSPRRLLSRKPCHELACDDAKRTSIGRTVST